MAKSEYARKRLMELGAKPKEKAQAPKPRVPKPTTRPESMIPLSAYADAKRYIETKRRDDPRPATWFDVRDAYLAGFRVGYYEARHSDPTGESQT